MSKNVLLVKPSASVKWILELEVNSVWSIHLSVPSELYLKRNLWKNSIKWCWQARHLLQQATFSEKCSTKMTLTSNKWKSYLIWLQAEAATIEEYNSRDSYRWSRRNTIKRALSWRHPRLKGTCLKRRVKNSLKALLPLKIQICLCHRTRDRLTTSRASRISDEINCSLI